jgi:hypothetical protein
MQCLDVLTFVYWYNIYINGEMSLFSLSVSKHDININNETFFLSVYLNICGVNPKEHGVKQELVNK